MPETFVRSEAARLGYYGKPTADLKAMVNRNIEGQFLSQESILNESSAKCTNKLNSWETQEGKLSAKYKMKRFSPTAFISGLLGIALLATVGYTGYLASPILMPVLLCLGFMGNIILYFKSISNPIWRPILFSALSCIGGGIIFSDLWINSMWWLVSMAAGLAVGIALYILNASLLVSLKNICTQVFAAWLSIRIWLSRNIQSYWQAKLVKESEKLNSVKVKKDTLINKYEHVIKYEYILGQTLKELHAPQHTTPKRNTKDRYTYAG